MVGLLRRLGPVDARNVARDPLLLWIALLPPAMALATRLGVPPLARLLRGALGFDLAPLLPLLLAGFALLAPTMVGMVVGFLLLDERDDRTLSALLVTPVAPAAYLGYRLLLPTLVGLASTLLCLPLAGLLPLSPATLLAVALLSAPSAALLALLLATFADNKVAGLALLKLLNVLLMLPLLAYFVAAPWQWLAGIFPSYWAAKALWLAVEGRSALPALAAGAVVNGAALVLLALRYRFELQRRGG